MKKLLLTLLTLLATSLTCNAAKSTGEAHAFKQPDGTTLMVRLLGDEDFSWYQTVDGVLLTRVDKAFYIAKTKDDGTLENTGIIAHNLDSRKADETAAAKAQNKTVFFTKSNNTASKAKAQKKSIAGYPADYYCPHSGTVRVPIILMNYADTVFTLTDKAVWEEYFNGTTKTPYTSETRNQGYGSVAQYFKDASYGDLNFVFDIYGPYTAKNGHDYYGKDKGYTRELSLLTEAVGLADDDIDFTQYDSDNDGRVDMVYIVYAGTGANLSQDNSDFWPACWSTAGSFASADGKTINIIGGANELARSAAKNKGVAIRAGIGVTCHEMSHGMGMPDLYWTSDQAPKDEQGYVNWNNCGPEDWDLMDGGENIYNAMWPCQYTAWERDIMGWITTEELTEPTDVTVYPLNKNGGKAYRVTNPDNANEYYVIENYMDDEWNYYINNKVGSGLMITHVNATSGISMSPNNTYGKPNITILPADGYILALYSAGETFPYKGEIVTMPKDETTVDESGKKVNKWQKNYYYPEAQGDPYVGSKYTGEPVTSVTAYKNYSGEKDMVETYPITDITRNSDGSISFKFMGGEPSAISEIMVSDEKKDANIYTIDGRLVGKERSGLPHGIYIQNGRKIHL